jgi:hypothetical protein
MRKISWAAGAAMLLGLSLQPAKAAYTILPADAVVAGKSIAAWTADWWTWAAQTSPSPLSDPTGAFANENNNGPVFFIAGNSGGTATRSFTVPAGKPILLPLINLFDIEPSPQTDPATLAQRKLAADLVIGGWVNSVDTASLFASIDGNPVPSPANYLEVSDFFDMGLVQEGSYLASNFGLPVGNETFPTKSAGYWLMITDLSLGSHELHFGGSSNGFDIPPNCCDPGPFPAFSTEMTDTIVVTPEPASAWPMLSGLLVLSLATRKRSGRRLEGST